MDDQCGLSGRAEFLKQRDNRPFSGRIDTGERFVHQVQVGVLYEGSCQKHPLLLPARQLADLPRGEVRQSDSIQGLAGH